jgi:hypothetical protein
VAGKAAVTDFAALVSALYRRLGTWARVATACGGTYSRTYYWRIARGTLPASPAIQEGILRATSEVTAVTSTETRDRRKTVHVYPECFTAGNLERKRLGLTWPEMVASWREDATNGKLDERRDDAG